MGKPDYQRAIDELKEQVKLLETRVRVLEERNLDGPEELDTEDIGDEEFLSREH